MRDCISCKASKPLSDYSVYKRSKSGVKAKCKTCTNRDERARVASNPTREHERKMRQRYPGVDRSAMLAEQDGKCLICGTTEPNSGVWATDHDHACCPGRYSCGNCVRGILCGDCNSGIGLLKDDPDVILAAAMYLLRSKDGGTWRIQTAKQSSTG